MTTAIRALSGFTAARQERPTRLRPTKLEKPLFQCCRLCGWKTEACLVDREISNYSATCKIIRRVQSTLTDYRVIRSGSSAARSCVTVCLTDPGAFNYFLLPLYRPINQMINHPISPLVNQSNDHKPINKINQPINQSVNQSVNLLINHIIQPTNRPLN